MIIEDHKVIFIHIPKNAGTAVEKYFGVHNLDTLYSNNERALKHNTIYEIKSKFSKKYKSYKKFAIVRNPYERMVSWYFHLKEEAEREVEFFNTTLEKAFPFGFIKWLEDPFKTQFTRWKLPNNKFVQTDKLLRNPQYTWIDETVTVLKYENLNEEINEFFGEEIDLPIINKSTHMSYLNYYNKHAFDIVYERYKEDFEKFNYERIEQI